jgi:methionyl-tRNA formyltransferase
MAAYVVATIRPWNIAKFQYAICKTPGEWHLIDEPSRLTIEILRKINPRYIFFPHWSEKVSNEITEQYECVCFHETDLPYGRGGSPIQNLIQRGYKETVITALKMSDIVDAGPVYMKRRLSLQGLAEEIYLRTADLVAEMIAEIVEYEPKPSPQEGEIVLFERRKPIQSQITEEIESLEHLFDLIRMLDAQGYPHAYLDAGKFRIQFRRPALRTDRIEADVTITLIRS